MRWLCASLVLLAVVGCDALDEASGRRDSGGEARSGEQVGQAGDGRVQLAAAAEVSTLPGLGGFLVWESNRSGRWRLWIRDLEGSEPRQLTPNEPRRRHCCAHVAPGGEWIAYLSLPAGKQEYSKGGVTGPLRLIRPDGSEEVELVPAARTYFEHRAAVWRSDRELIYIDDQGRTSVFDIETGKVSLLTSGPVAEYGRLIDARLSHATGGRADFSPYDADRRTVAARPDAPGCQPYFSHDGRWGFWMAGVGGPISRLDLATREISPILHKNDPRLPPGLGYLYFPMVSRDGLLMAFAASPGQHDHFRSDYEIFVAETDPELLELVGSPVRFTHHPGTDRFPDVHVRPLALGRKFVEAPHTVQWRAPEEGEWSWSGASGGARGRTFSETYDEAGRFEVTATDGTTEVRGLAVVRGARPPSPVAVRLLNEGRLLKVLFDEPVDSSTPSARLESGTPIGAAIRSEDGRSWSFELGAQVRGPDTLILSGARDLAQRPNVMESAEIAIETPLWPTNREGLAFLWGTRGTPNLIFDRGLAAERASVVEATERAVFDRDFRMILGRGKFVASSEDATQVLTAARAANRFSLEAFATPGESGRLVAMGGKQLNFALRAEGDSLYFTFRVGSRGPAAFGGGRAARFQPGRSVHVVATFEPGKLKVYVDGERVADWPLQGDLFNWRLDPLTFGDGVTTAAGERAALEGIAIYARVLPEDEVRENWQRYTAQVEARVPVEPLEVDARLVRSSRTPSLEEISPYTEALALEEWRVVGSRQEPVRVARWAVLDGKPLPREEIGARRQLRLEPFDANPQLEGVFVQDDLGPAEGGVYYDID